MARSARIALLILAALSSPTNAEDQSASDPVAACMMTCLNRLLGGLQNVAPQVADNPEYVNILLNSQSCKCACHTGKVCKRFDFAERGAESCAVNQTNPSAPNGPDDPTCKKSAVECLMQLCPNTRKVFCKNGDCPSSTP